MKQSKTFLQCSPETIENKLPYARHHVVKLYYTNFIDPNCHFIIRILPWVFGDLNVESF